MIVGALVLLGVLAAVAAFGLWRRRVDGRLRPVRVAPLTGASPAGDRPADDRALSGHDLGAALGERATLVQFSSAFCAPCRTTRVVLDEVSAMMPGVAHVEVDAAANLDLVRRLDVRRTPTVLVLDADGRVRTRASGAPRKAEVIAALGAFL